MNDEHEHAASAARETLEKLEAKEQSLAGRLTKNAAERRELAFRANTGDQAAKSKLQALHEQSAALNLQREDMSAALAEARVRVAAAEKTLAASRTVEQAQAILEKLPAVRERLARFDALVTELCTIAADLPGLYAEVAGARSPELLRGTLRRAVQGPLFVRGTHLHAEVLPPFLRKPAAEAMAPVIENIEREMRGKIDGAEVSVQRSAA
jgi:hypothetical protein